MIFKAHCYRPIVVCSPSGASHAEKKVPLSDGHFDSKQKSLKTL